MSEEMFRDHVRQQLRLQLRTGLDLETAIDRVKATFHALGPAAGRMIEDVCREFRERIDRIETLGEGMVLESRKEGATWYDGPSEDPSSCWQMYRRRLENEQRWRRSALDRIDRESTLVLSRMAPPRAASGRRGLVVGYVQSGKTANMIALITKACDAGFRNFLVLAGLTDKLRSQTQRRFERDLADYPSGVRRRWTFWTRPDMDFDAGAPGQLFLETSCNNIAIIKKNRDVLERFLAALDSSGLDVRQSSWVVVDDECDNGSINILYHRDMIATINGLIRKILSVIPQSNYVGYTATPYANLLIDPETSPDHPEDLYPRDFIISLSRPDGYQGPEIFFGRDVLGGDEGADDGADDRVRIISAEEDRLWSAWSKSCDGSAGITTGLATCMDWFLLASAERRIRAAGANTTMLVHVSPRIRCHDILGSILRRELEARRQAWMRGDFALRERLRQLWMEECRRRNGTGSGGGFHSFEELEPVIGMVLSGARVKIVHSQVREDLDYEDGGQHWIVVGGNILSRGITLDGLVATFFTRYSRQYDTLMQMGRWFGFRPGYEDLPRIWTTERIYYAFSNLVLVEEEMRDEMRVFVERPDLTPLEYAVRIRRCPGMLVTSPVRMGAARVYTVSYSDRLVQTRIFHHRNSEWLRDNLQAWAGILGDAAARGPVERRPGGRVYRGVPREVVVRFLRAYRVHENHRDMMPDSLLQYVVRMDDISHWNVALVEPGRGQGPRRNVEGFGTVQTVRRARLRTHGKPVDADIKALVSRGDILLDLPPDAETIPTDASVPWAKLRRLRERAFRERGEEVRPLLLLYLIDRESPPGPGRRNREPLHAMDDVAAYAILFPRRADEGRDYVQVELRARPGEEEYEDETEEREGL